MPEDFDGFEAMVLQRMRDAQAAKIKATGGS